MKNTFLRLSPRRWAILVLATITMIVPAFLLHSTAVLAAPPSGRSVISGHLVPALQHHSPLHTSSANRQLQLSIALNLRNKSALEALVRAQSDPHSSLYHQYLTPQQFTAQFSPTEASVRSVVNYLHSQGLQVSSVASNRLLIDASGSLSAVERAFNITIADYALNGSTVYAPTSEPSVPANLSGLVLNISGLDNAAHYHPAKHMAPAAGPGGGYTPTDLRTAYDMNSLISSANGSGQTVAIFELDGYNASDVNTYLSQYSLGSAKYSNVLVDGATNTAGAGAIEVELDMEVVSAIAPGATQKIYIGPNSTTGVNDTYNKIVTDNVAKVTSTSWGLCEASSGTSELSALDNIFLQGSSQGQSFFAASGDSGAYDCNNTSLAVDSPADDPHVVGVGGTNLQLGSGSSYGSESAWSNPNDTQRSPKGSGGGGGYSTYFSKPSYQSGTGVDSNSMRHVPDVSADADPASGYSVYCTVSASGCSSGSAGWIAVGGTSAAAPLWAGVAADVNSYLAGQGKSTLGNVNAELYTLFNTSQTYTAYHDVTSGNNLHYNAGTGYDLATGIGTPDAWNFARDAAGTTGGGTNDFSISASPTSLSIAQGGNGTSIISTAVTTGSAGTVSLTASVSPAGPTASLSPTSVTAGGSSTLTVSVGSSVAAGTYTVTVTGTEGSATHTASVTVTVTTSGGGTTTQALANPGFENGQTPWQESSSGGYQLIDTTLAHSGSYSAYQCGYNNCNDQIWQSVAIPSTATTIKFTFWLYVSTQESGSTCYDYFYARLRTSSGSTISTVKSLCNNTASGWKQYTFDVSSTLSSYKGQTVQVYFQGTTDSSLPTNFFVDDAALNITTP
ncbi:S53 family peptidase [Ktedonobacter sp. SOSP1-52]|uniref:S53 family peptidase n=1 Tax=Ktedonobacter sp. SOSP1-52 TaxID=2778366 RepID=UPI001F2EC675|nr:S53 family peptidase [Ktedonobacter sp. SOSP1-52]